MKNRPGLRSALAAVAAITLFVPNIGGGSESTTLRKIHFIEISELRFIPDNLPVKPGDTVTWINRDIVPHSATAIDNSWDTGTINLGESRSIVVTQKFNLRYFCPFHPSMQAQLDNGLN